MELLNDVVKGINNVKKNINNAKKVIDKQTADFELLDLKKEVVEKFVEKLKEEKGGVLLSLDLWESAVKDYLVNASSFDDLTDNVLENTLLQFFDFLPQLKEIREKLNKAKTSEELRALETEILSKSSVEVPPEVDGQHSEVAQEATQETNQAEIGEQSSSPLQNNKNLTFADVSPEQEHIKAVIQTAQKQIGKPYSRGGVGPEGFDCSGLWNYAFKEQGITFQDRFTAALFSKTDVDIQRDQVKVGDFMYWDAKPGSKKHNPIYHIEMVVEKPFFKNGKWFVKTLGSSTDKGILDSQGKATKRQGVGYRLREIQSYRHFGRPPYYLQLAQAQQNGDAGKLIASSTQKVDAHTKEQLLA